MDHSHHMHMLPDLAGGGLGGLAGGDPTLWALPLSLFLVGLIGGAMHCTAMCGPFVLMQVGAQLDRTGTKAYGLVQRLAGASLIPYHLGRATTYVFFGAIAGAAAGGLSSISMFGWLPGALLAAAALVFLLKGIEGLWPRLRHRLAASNADPAAGGGLIARLARPFLIDPRGTRGYALGIVLGLLPCGFLWGALAAAGGSGSAVGGALAMLGFVLGTVPALMGVGIVGLLFARRAGRAVGWVAPALYLVNAAWLALFAWRALA